MINPILHYLKKHGYIVLLICIFGVAGILRIAWLNEYPIGFHFDEAWYGYNAFLLLQRGMNIYGQKWPIDLDILGDFVPALHAYLSIPFVAIFGMQALSVRIVTVLASLGCLIVSIVLLRMFTKQKAVVIVFSVLFALSPWNIMMARASSTVILDTFVLLLFCVMYTATLRSIAQSAENKNVFFGVLTTYGIAVLAYFTYFTSRILIAPFGLVLLGHACIVNQLPKKKIMIGLLPLFLYLIFPFVSMMRTPFALGRYQQVTLIQSGEVRGRLFIDIAESGQAGVPVLPTRMLYNKLTENFALFVQHYAVFFSPNPMLFQTHPPLRYYLARVGAITPVEYVGLCLAVCALFLTKQQKHAKSILIIFLLFLTLSAMPSALTLDDFPNLQRAVIMTPFLQIVAAIGLVAWWQHMEWEKHIVPCVVGVILCTVPSVFMLVIAYRVHQRWEKPFYRNTATIEVSHWINAHAQNDTLLLDHRDGTFLYPYLLAHDNMLDETIETSAKNFITAEYVRIGKRTFIKHLCEKPDMLMQDYDRVVLFIGEGCKIPWWMTTVYVAPFSNGSPGFAVLQPDQQIQHVLRSEYVKETSKEKQRALLLRALSDKEGE